MASAGQSPDHKPRASSDPDDLDSIRRRMTEQDSFAIARLYPICDLITEWMLYFLLVFSPWAFGTTQRWSIAVMNAGSYILGATLVVKWLIRWKTGYRPPRWSAQLMPSYDAPPSESLDHHETKRQRMLVIITRWLAALTITSLGICAVSALNARAALSLETGGFVYLKYVAWLPHSYNQAATWNAFWSYLGLALMFWAVRDWVMGRTLAEQQTYWDRYVDHLNPSAPLIPARLRRVLWAICINGAVLGLACILQRLSGTRRLLWVMDAGIGDADFHFGPFNYRGNGAQYFNLLWPVCLGFWWIIRARHQSETQLNERMGTGAHALLLPLAIITGACPIITTNRVGALLALASLPVVFTLLYLDSRRTSKTHWGLLPLTFGCVMAFALYLGWQPLQKRLSQLAGIYKAPSTAYRFDQWAKTWEMVQDHPVWGAGPYAYSTVYKFYVDPGELTYTYTHNDWLQTLAEWGSIGFACIIGALALALIAPLVQTTGFFGLTAGLYIGAGMVLAHGMIDFPLQVYSILFTFLLLLALLISLPPRRHFI